MRSLLPLLTAPLFLSGCGPGISGVWLLAIKFVPDDQIACEDVVDSNFTDAEPKTEEAATGTSTTTQSDTLVFVSIEENPDGDAVLVFQNAVYPGVENDDGSWSFAWTAESHPIGATDNDAYNFERDVDTIANQVLKLTFQKDDLTGTMSTLNKTVGSWSETDMMTVVVPGMTSQIPSAEWLVKPVGENMFPVSNDLAVEDCKQDPCTLDVDSSCKTDQGVTGTRTGYESADEYGGISGARQASGT